MHARLPPGTRLAARRAHCSWRFEPRPILSDQRIEVMWCSPSYMHASASGVVTLCSHTLGSHSHPPSAESAAISQTLRTCPILRRPFPKHCTQQKDRPNPGAHSRAAGRRTSHHGARRGVSGEFCRLLSLELVFATAERQPIHPMDGMQLLACR